MTIDGILWLSEVISKIRRKHHVISSEVEQVFADKPKFYFLQRGEREGENVYLALGQTDSGRYLAVIFIYKKNREAFVLSARSMAIKERKRYHEK